MFTSCRRHGRQFAALEQDSPPCGNGSTWCARFTNLERSLPARGSRGRRRRPRRRPRRARRRPPVSGRRRRRARAGPRRRPRPTSSRSGPASVPSRSIAVQRTRSTPASRQSSTARSGRQARRLRPAGGPHLPVAHVERDDEPLAERLGPRRRDRGRRPCRRRPGRRRPSSSASASSSERMPPEAWSRAGATAVGDRAHELGRGRGRSARRRGRRDGSARAPAAANAPRERDRVAGALDDVVVVAPVEAHGALAEHVDGGDHLDRGTRAIRIARRPC